MHRFTLQSIYMQNFKMFREADVNFEPDLTILIGDNGSGKSTILDAARIAIASFFIKLETNSAISIARTDATRVAYSYANSVRTEAQYPVTVGAEAVIDGIPTHWERRLKTPKGKTTRVGASSVMHISEEWQKAVRQGDSSVVLPVFTYYGTNRLWKASNVSAAGKIEMQGRLAGYDNCLDACIDYELMRTWFKRQAFSEFQRKEASRDYRIVKDMLASALTDLVECSNASVGFDAEEDDIVVSYIDDNNCTHYDPVKSMSDGYRDVFILLADIAFRMTLLNPGLEEEVLTSTPGIVLIDELDLHLHPKWQALIVPVLTKAFPNVQFVGTTHSPIILSSIPSRHIRLLEHGQLFLPSSETYGNAVSSVLLSAMGTRDRIPSIAKLFINANALLSRGELSQVENILDKIEEAVGQQDPDVKALKLSLSLAKMESGLL